MDKAGGSDGIPVELFQILKDDAVEILTIVRLDQASIFHHKGK